MTTYQSFANAQAKIAETKVSAFTIRSIVSSTSQVNVSAFTVRSITEMSPSDVRISAFAIRYITNRATFNSGQSQASILKSAGYGQAQTEISSSFFVDIPNYAQAQAYILLLQSSYAQSQAQILLILQSYAQAETWIYVTQQSWAQTSVHILTLNNIQSAQVQVKILGAFQAFAQSEADILQIYQKYAQSQALIRVEGILNYGNVDTYVIILHQDFAQAQANLLVPYQVYAQAKGYLRAYDIQQYALAQAQFGVFWPAQSQAQINSFDTGRYANALALIGISRIMTLFYDSFGRIESGTWGTPEEGTYENLYKPSNVVLSINGSKGLITNPAGDYGGGWYTRFKTDTFIYNLELYYEYRLISADSDPDYIQTSITIRDTATGGAYRNTGVWIDIDTVADDPRIDMGEINTSLSSNVPMSDLDRGLRVYAIRLRADGNMVYIRTWPLDESEPTYWQNSLNTTNEEDNQPGNVVMQWWAYHYNIADNPLIIEVDNISIVGEGISTINYWTGFAVADILQTYIPAAQAQTILNQSMYVGQAQADIKQEYSKSAQARCWVRKSAGYANAQAKVLFVLDSYGEMVQDDGASHLYGLHTYNSAMDYQPGYQWEYWRDEIGNLDCSYSYYSNWTNDTVSPIYPEKIGLSMGYYWSTMGWRYTYGDVPTEFTTNNWSMEGWVKSPSSTNVLVTIFSIKPLDFGSNFDIYFGSPTTSSAGNSIAVHIRDITVGSVYYDTGITYTANTWYHVVVTFDNYTFKIYVNGALTNTISRTTWLHSLIDRVYVNYSTYWGVNTSDYYIGIDNLVIYPVTLSQEIIDKHNIHGLNLHVSSGNATVAIDSYIKPNWAQAQAFIGTYRVIGFANTDIKQTYNRSANARAWIGHLQYAITRAYIKAIGWSRHAQARTKIYHFTYDQSAQAQVYISAFDVNQFALAEAWFGIFRPAQALAQILSFDYPQRAQAQALIHGKYGIARITWLSDTRYYIGTPYAWDAETRIGYPNYAHDGEFPSTYVRQDDWGMAWSAVFVADETGTWQFQTTSDDWSDVWISGIRVVDNGSEGTGHSRQTRSGGISLVSGQLYTLHARWCNGPIDWDIIIQYKRPSDSSWKYLTSDNPPWMHESYYAGYGQAQVKILTAHQYGYGQAETSIKIVSKVTGFAQADIKQTYEKSGLANALLIWHFNLAQAQAYIYRVYAQSANAMAYLGWVRFANAQAKINAYDYPRHAQAQAKLRAYNVQKYGQAQVFSVNTHSGFANAIVTIKQTYPLFHLSPNYATPTYGASVSIDPEEATFEGSPNNIIDSRSDTFWTGFVDPTQTDITYITIDLGASRTITSYSILPHKYNATVSLQCAWYQDQSWETIVENIYFDVHLDTPLSPSNAVQGTIESRTRRYWRLKVVNGGDDNWIGLADFQLGQSTIINGTFAQALAQLGHFGHGQAAYYISPGMGSQSGQAKAQIVQTYIVSGQANAYIIPPTWFGNATVDILQTYTICVTANAYIIPPTWVGNALTTIFATASQHGLAAVSIKQVYLKLAQAGTFITKPRGFGQSQVWLTKLLNLTAHAQAKIGHQYSGLAMALIHKGGFAVAQAQIMRTTSRCASVAFFIVRKEGYALANAVILRIYERSAQALTILNQYMGMAAAQAIIIQTYSKLANSQARIKAIYGGYGQALGSVFWEVPWCGNARVWISRQYQVSAIATTQIGYFKYAQAQARIISFNVPKLGNAGCYILVDTSIPIEEPSSDYAAYLVNFEGRKIPGYANSESYDSVLNIIGDGYRNASMKLPDMNYPQVFADYNGLENKTVTLKMMLWETSYMAAKDRLQEAATILRSIRGGFGRLYIQYYDKYYLAHPQSITMEKQAGTSSKLLSYDITFRTKPWLISNETYSIEGTGTIDTGDRTLLDGGWTPTVITVTGNNISITGVTDDSQSTGSITVSGAVTDYEIDSETFTTGDNSLITPQDYGIYVGPGKTTFTVSGATNCRIEWHNRWYL